MNFKATSLLCALLGVTQCMASNDLQFSFDEGEEGLANTVSHKATQVQEQPEEKEIEGTHVQTECFFLFDEEEEGGEGWKQYNSEEEAEKDQNALEKESASETGARSLEPINGFFPSDESPDSTIAPLSSTAILQQLQVSQPTDNQGQSDDDHTDLAIKKATPYPTSPNNSPAISIPAGGLCWFN